MNVLPLTKSRTSAIAFLGAVEFLITDTVVALKCFKDDGDVTAEALFLIFRYAASGIVDNSLGSSVDIVCREHGCFKLEPRELGSLCVEKSELVFDIVGR
jgi:hypothetical protein